jgi:hypothetical protein
LEYFAKTAISLVFPLAAGNRLDEKNVALPQKLQQATLQTQIN